MHDPSLIIDVSFDEALKIAHCMDNLPDESDQEDVFIVHNGLIEQVGGVKNV